MFRVLESHVGTLVCAGYMFTSLSKMTLDCKLYTSPALALKQDKEICFLNPFQDYFLLWVILGLGSFKITWDWALCNFRSCYYETDLGNFDLTWRPRSGDRISLIYNSLINLSITGLALTVSKKSNVLNNGFLVTNTDSKHLSLLLPNTNDAMVF